MHDEELFSMISYCISENSAFTKIAYANNICISAYSAKYEICRNKNKNNAYTDTNKLIIENARINSKFLFTRSAILNSKLPKAVIYYLKHDINIGCPPSTALEGNETFV